MTPTPGSPPAVCHTRGHVSSQAQSWPRCGGRRSCVGKAGFTAKTRRCLGESTSARRTESGDLEEQGESAHARRFWKRPAGRWPWASRASTQGRAARSLSISAHSYLTAESGPVRVTSPSGVGAAHWAGQVTQRVRALGPHRVRPISWACFSHMWADCGRMPPPSRKPSPPSSWGPRGQTRA